MTDTLKSHEDSKDGHIRTSRVNGVMEMIIDRPSKLNGFTPKMFNELIDAYKFFEEDPKLRCAVVTAEGAHFTAGLDLPKALPTSSYLPPLAIATGQPAI